MVNNPFNVVPAVTALFSQAMSGSVSFFSTVWLFYHIKTYFWKLYDTHCSLTPLNTVSCFQLAWAKCILIKMCSDVCLLRIWDSFDVNSGQKLGTAKKTLLIMIFTQIMTMTKAWLSYMLNLGNSVRAKMRKMVKKINPRLRPVITAVALKCLKNVAAQRWKLFAGGVHTFVTTSLKLMDQHHNCLRHHQQKN